MPSKVTKAWWTRTIIRKRKIAEMLVMAGARLDTKNQFGLDVFSYTKDEAFKGRFRALAARR